MRKPALVLSLLVFGCDSDTTTTSVSLELRSNLVGGVVCFAMNLSNEVGATLFEVGDRSSTPATLAEAKASGAVCVETTTLVNTRCSAGPSKATAWVVGFYSTDGVRAEDAFIDPCGSGGCQRTFECVEGQEASVVFDFPIARRANQGFLDIAILGDTAPAGATGVCYSVRVSNGQGETVMGQQDLCSTDYGDGLGGDISYIVTCDAEHADNTVAIWVHPPDGATAPYDTPCPAPTSGSIDDWTDGCVRTVTCLENQDITVEFDLETEAR